jgi:PAS domain S-box-containing protein
MRHSISVAVARGRRPAARWTFFDKIPSGIPFADISAGALGHLVKVNRSMTEITGYTQQDLLTMSVAI